MAELSNDQKKFLRGYSIPLGKVFDGTGLSRAQYQKAMTDTEQAFAFGTTPCTHGHTLRSKAGHCIQCDPKKIAYQLRSASKSHVYIAGSYNGKLIKIGSSKDIEGRIKQLNSYQYGGQKDWKALASAYVDKAGRVENYIQKELSEFSVEGTYQREGREQICYELFRCDFDDALKKLKALGGKSLKFHGAKPEAALKVYRFR